MKKNSKLFGKIYEEVLELRERLSLEGSGETFEEDHLLIDKVISIMNIFESAIDKEKLIELAKECRLNIDYDLDNLGVDELVELLIYEI